ncbi:type II secretion system protein [Psychrilyobacter atlanticus]|uniref:type II secretion system protein n=1 Tax=Psychrilyobacter atlanticus TaxID=271091 RepID=UPI000419D9B4|nr:type II secretion system protein [Psychrilyobacter atlanticus]
MKNNKYGFTLIELLIVIAIIGILATTLAPKLRAQLAKAKDAKVVSFLGASRTGYQVLSMEKMINNSDDSVVPTVKLSEILDKLDSKASPLIDHIWGFLRVGGSKKNLTSELRYSGTIHLMSGSAHDTKNIFYESQPQPIDEIITLEPFSEYTHNNIEKYSTEGLQWNKY